MSYEVEVVHGFGVTCSEAHSLVEAHRAKGAPTSWWCRGLDSEEPYARVTGTGPAYRVTTIDEDDWHGPESPLARGLVDGDIEPEAVFDSDGGNQ